MSVFAPEVARPTLVFRGFEAVIADVNDIDALRSHH